MNSWLLPVLSNKTHKLTHSPKIFLISVPIEWDESDLRGSILNGTSIGIRHDNSVR
jgi:hypothetical protein